MDKNKNPNIASEDFSAVIRGLEDSFVRQAVTAVSRGNVNLQLGRYITEGDKKKLREQMEKYDIKAPI
ncbi:hypothetical protein [Mesotoga prima]|uniref:hypothetical protein n=1 Tax=Mesotoga prima TaxID=1184387 RepID=UPI002FDACB7C